MMAKKIKRKDITLGMLGEICACYEGCKNCPFYVSNDLFVCYVSHNVPDSYRYDFLNEEIYVPDEVLSYVE